MKIGTEIDPNADFKLPEEQEAVRIAELRQEDNEADAYGDTEEIPTPVLPLSAPSHMAMVEALIDTLFSDWMESTYPLTKDNTLNELRELAYNNYQEIKYVWRAGFKSGVGITLEYYQLVQGKGDKE